MLVLGSQMFLLLFQPNKLREVRTRHTHVGDRKQPSVARRPLGNKALFQLKARKTICHSSTPTVNFPPCITLIHLMCHQEKHRRGTAPPLMANARLARRCINLRQPCKQPLLRVATVALRGLLLGHRGSQGPRHGGHWPRRLTGSPPQRTLVPRREGSLLRVRQTVFSNSKAKHNTSRGTGTIMSL